jgi:hypothetical protein
MLWPQPVLAFEVVGKFVGKFLMARERDFIHIFPVAIG